MADKVRIPFRFDVEVEENFEAGKRWHAQFKIYPLGYFRAKGPTPGAALAIAWKRFRKEIDPGSRWWVAVRRLWVFALCAFLLFAGCGHDYAPAVKRATAQIVAVTLPELKHPKHPPRFEKLDRVKKVLPLYEQISVADCPPDFRASWAEWLQAFRDYIAALQKDEQIGAHNFKILLESLLLSSPGPLSGLELGEKNLHPAEVQLNAASHKLAQTAQKYLDPK